MLVFALDQRWLLMNLMENAVPIATGDFQKKGVNIPKWGFLMNF